MSSQLEGVESNSGRVLQRTRRVMLSGLGPALLTVAVVIGLVGIPVLTGAVDRHGHDGNEKKTLTGNWISTATRLDPLPGQAPTFLSLQTFFEDGNFLEENNEAALRSTGRGHWERIGHRQFVNSFIFFRFDAAGTYLGTVQPTTTITLSADGSQFQGDTVAQIHDASGNLLRTVRIAGVGERL